MRKITLYLKIQRYYITFFVKTQYDLFVGNDSEKREFLYKKTDEKFSSV